MTALDFSKLSPASALAGVIAPQPAASETSSAPRAEKPKAEFWANIGMTVPLTNPLTGEIETTFVSLPFGSAVDTMDPVEIKGQNVNYNNLQEGKNALRQHLLDVGANLQPGQEVVLPYLQVQLRRVGKPAASAPGQNPFLQAMAGVIAPKV